MNEKEKKNALELRFIKTPQNLIVENTITLPVKPCGGWMVESYSEAVLPKKWREVNTWECHRNLKSVDVNAILGFKSLIAWITQKFVDDKHFRVHTVSWVELDCCDHKYNLVVHETHTPTEFNHKFGLREGERWADEGDRK